MALIILLVFHAHSAWAAFRTTVEIRSAPKGLIAMITFPIRWAISISLLSKATEPPTSEIETRIVKVIHFNTDDEIDLGHSK